MDRGVSTVCGSRASRARTRPCCLQSLPGPRPTRRRSRSRRRSSPIVPWPSTGRHPGCGKPVACASAPQPGNRPCGSTRKSLSSLTCLSGLAAILRWITSNRSPWRRSSPCRRRRRCRSWSSGRILRRPRCGAARQPAARSNSKCTASVSGVVILSRRQYSPPPAVIRRGTPSPRIMRIGVDQVDAPIHEVPVATGLFQPPDCSGRPGDCRGSWGRGPHQRSQSSAAGGACGVAILRAGGVVDLGIDLDDLPGLARLDELLDLPERLGSDAAGNRSARRDRAAGPASTIARPSRMS